MAQTLKIKKTLEEDVRMIATWRPLWLICFGAVIAFTLLALFFSSGSVEIKNPAILHANELDAN